MKTAGEARGLRAKARGNSEWKVRKQEKKQDQYSLTHDKYNQSIAVSTSIQNFIFYRLLTKYVTRNLMLI